MISLSEIGDFRLYGDDDLPVSTFFLAAPLYPKPRSVQRRL